MLGARRLDALEQVRADVGAACGSIDNVVIVQTDVTKREDVRCHMNGCHCICTYLHTATTATTAAVVIVIDLLFPQLQRLVRTAEETFGPVDILVNNGASVVYISLAQQQSSHTNVIPPLLLL